MLFFCDFSLNIFEYPKYQHQYYHNQLKNHRYIGIIQSFSQLKNLLKHCLNKMELHLFQNLCFEFVYFNPVNKHITIHLILMQT